MSCSSRKRRPRPRRVRISLPLSGCTKHARESHAPKTRIRETPNQKDQHTFVWQTDSRCFKSMKPFIRRHISMDFIQTTTATVQKNKCNAAALVTQIHFGRLATALFGKQINLKIVHRLMCAACEQQLPLNFRTICCTNTHCWIQTSCLKKMRECPRGKLL